MEDMESRRLLDSEHRLCVCQDEMQEQYHALKATSKDLRFHSDILKLSSLSRYLRAVIFHSRKLQGISMPFYRSALDRCAAIRDVLKEDVR